MEIQEMHDDKEWKRIEKSHRRGKIMGGLLIVAIGSLFLARELGVEIPVWVFTWKMLLIGLGIVAAIKHKFLHPAWIILVGVGGIFLLNDLYPEMQIRPILWPSIAILAGLIIIFKPHRKNMQFAHHHWKKWQKHNYGHRGWYDRNNWQNEHVTQTDETRASSADEDYLDSVNFFGGTKKNILTKTFKGGDVVNVFGGSHLNLSQADLDGAVTLTITQVFGGTKLIVPANWEIKSETVTVCGGIEDKRPLQPSTPGEKQKVLVLIGTTIFGGIEIKSFE